MAMVDYGVIVLKDGVFVNKNFGLFRHMIDAIGCDIRVVTDEDGNPVDLDGNFFDYIGDKDMFIAFYRYQMVVVKDKKIVWSFWGQDCDSQTRYFSEGNVTVELLDKNKYKDEYKLDSETLQRYYNDLDKNTIRRIMSKFARDRKVKRFKKNSGRLVVTWEYNGHKYKVIYGYGIDNQEEVWKDIRFKYDFTDNDRSVIDPLFQ